MRSCANPACSRRPRRLRRGLCDACYQYLLRTGRHRPEAVIVENGYRQVVRQLEARALGIH